MNGEIKKIVADKGFGFIRGDDGMEYFVHRSAFRGVEFDAAYQGQRVTFDASRSEKGPRAQNVRLVEKGSA